MKLTNILLEGLGYWKIDALIKTDAKMNKMELLNQIRAVQGIVVLEVIHSEFLDGKSGNLSEYSLITFKFIARGKPMDELELIKSLATTGTTKIIGLQQFHPRLKTLKQLGKY